MSRFEEMLSTLLPAMQIHWQLKPMLSQGVRERFAMWKAKQQALDAPFDAAYSFEQVPDTQDVWRLGEADFLYRDRFLRITPTLDEYCPAASLWRTFNRLSMQDVFDDNLFRYGLLAQTREELATRLSRPETWITLFAMHMSHALHISYAVDAHKEMPLFRVYQRLATLTAPFFGQGFRPLLEALKLHLAGPRERVLHPFTIEGAGCVIAAAEVDRLVAEHLGLTRFACRSGKKAAGQEESYDARVETYTNVDRGKVAAYLAAQRRETRAVDTHLLLCELALRKVIPSGVYVVQAE